MHRHIPTFALIALALLVHPLPLGSQNSFSLSLDANSAAGDQGVTSVTTSASQEVAIQIFGGNIQNAIGISARFEYDASQVTYDKFDEGSVFPNSGAFDDLDDPTNPTYVEVVIASLGSQATVNSGLVGTIYFRTSASFTGTSIRLVRSEINRGGQLETVTLNASIALSSGSSGPSGPSADFNGDGTVNVADFLDFVEVFGSQQGDGKYDAKYDLVRDGAITVADFLRFVDDYGKTVPSDSSGGTNPPPDSSGGTNPTASEPFRDCAECPLMVKIPPGSFTMGMSDSEFSSFFTGPNYNGPPHRVSIGYSFAVGVHEVTFDEWEACPPCTFYTPSDADWGKGNRPLIFVDWNDAQVYLEWLSSHTGARYRLLSEAEWEYAARAGTTGPYHFGNKISTDQANFNPAWEGSGVNRNQTVPVGSFPANAFGLHDVHGNVWEWTQDCWHGNYQGAPSDGSAWGGDDCGDGSGLSNRVLRGGSWQDPSPIVRSSFRSSASSNDIRNVAGFRVARDLTP